MINIPPRLLLNPLHFLSFGFGAGLSPRAPGTCGTLIAVPLYIGFADLPLTWYFLLLLIAFGVGVIICEYTSRAMGVHDHPGIVWDEFVGYWITMVGVPPDWLWIFLGFVLFRTFDIWKPWPVKVADRTLKGGFGIMFDDVLAGIYALICLHLVIWAIETYV